MKNNKTKKLMPLLLGISVLILEGKSTNANVKQEDNSTLENGFENKKKNFKFINLYDEGGSNNLSNVNNGYKYPISNSHNAYSFNRKVYVPYDIGRYEEYYTNDLDPIYENERQRFEIFDERRNWSSYHYQEHLVNGNRYVYTGEYRNQYSINTCKLHRYKREFRKTIEEKIYEKKYKHYYKGNKWWNCLLTKTYVNNNQNNYPSYSNYNHTKCEQIKGQYLYSNYKDVLLKTEYSDWKLSKPFRWPWDPDWEVFDTKYEYSLSFDRVLKWNPTALQGFKCLKPININTNDFKGLHLAQWNDISNLIDPEEYITSYNEGRIDYFYFKNEQVIQDIYRVADHIVDVFRDEIIDDYLNKKNIDSAIELICSVGSLALSYTFAPASMVLSILSIIDSIKEFISVNFGSEKKRLNSIKESGKNIFNKLTDEMLLKYNYCVFKVDQYGIDLDYFDLKNNPYDNINDISLSYKDNEIINGSLSCYRDKNFTSIYGYPTLFNDFSYFHNTSLGVFKKENPTIEKDLNELVLKGIYSYL